MTHFHERDRILALLAASILSANFSRLGAEVKAVESSGAGMIHIDVMDGHFVPDISLGPMIVTSLKKVTNLPLDVHLMVSHPADHISSFIRAGADFLSFHEEASDHPLAIIRRVKEQRVKAGLALNPSTSIECLSHVIQDLDFVLIMSVHPGRPGQPFINGTEKKVAELRSWIKAKGYSVKIEVDGGLTEKNMALIKNAGADYLVAGSAIFGSKDPKETVRKMVKLIGG